MNDQSGFDEIEELLRQAPLREPGPRLNARVTQTLRSSRWNPISRRIRFGAWSVAATLFLALGCIWAIKHFAPHQEMAGHIGVQSPAHREPPLLTFNPSTVKPIR